MQHVKCRSLTRLLGSSFCLSSSTDEIQSRVSILHVETFFNGRLEHLEHEFVIGVETDGIEDISVGNDTEGTEDDGDGNVNFDIGEFDSNEVTLISMSWFSSAAPLYAVGQDVILTAPPSRLGYILTSISLNLPDFSK